MDLDKDSLPYLLIYSSGYLHKMFHEKNLENEKGLFSCLDEEEQNQLKISRDLLFQFPAMIILSSLWGIMGLLWAAPVADVLAFIVSFIFIAIQMKRLTKEGEKALET